MEAASKAYQKLSELVERYDKAVQTLENASGKVNESLRQLLQESEVMKETATEMNPITSKFREEVREIVRSNLDRNYSKVEVLVNENLAGTKAAVEENLAGTKAAVEENLANARAIIEDDFSNAKTQLAECLTSTKGALGQSVIQTKRVLEEGLSTTQSTLDDTLTNTKALMDAEVRKLNNSVSELKDITFEQKRTLMERKTLLEEVMDKRIDKALKTIVKTIYIAGGAAVALLTGLFFWLMWVYGVI